MLDSLRTRLEHLTQAVAVIRDLRAAGKSYGYIATALNIAGIPTLDQGTEWRRGVVHAIARAEGIA